MSGPHLAALFTAAAARGLPGYRLRPRAELAAALAAEPPPPAPARLERDGPLAVVVLDDPARRNALGEAAFAALERVLGAIEDALEADESLRLVALAGTGPAFCAGAAIAEYDPLPDGARLLSQRGTALAERLAALPVPVVALLHGHAVGGGAELALACDLRLADPAAELRLVHTGIGLVPGWGGALALARIVGDAVAFRLLALRAVLGGEEALAAGLVDELVPADELRSRAAALAAHLERGDRSAVARLKRLLRSPPGGRPDAARDAFLESWPARRIDHVRPTR